MRKIIIAAFIAALPTRAASQQTSQPPKRTQKYTQHPVTRNPCAQYGVTSLGSRARIHALRLAAALASKAVAAAGGNSLSAEVGHYAAGSMSVGSHYSPYQSRAPTVPQEFQFKVISVFAKRPGLFFFSATNRGDPSHQDHWRTTAAQRGVEQLKPTGSARDQTVVN
jgi:hypothetical protein